MQVLTLRLMNKAMDTIQTWIYPYDTPLIHYNHHMICLMYCGKSQTVVSGWSGHTEVTYWIFIWMFLMSWQYIYIYVYIYIYSFKISIISFCPSPDFVATHRANTGHEMNWFEKAVCSQNNSSFCTVKILYNKDVRQKYRLVNERPT